MRKKAKQYYVASLIFALVAISVASLAGVVYLARGGDSLPAVALPAATVGEALPSAVPSDATSATTSPAATASASAASSARATPPTASAAASVAPAVTAAEAATPAPTPVATQTPKPTPSPKATAAATKAPKPKATAAPAKIAEKNMTINALIARMPQRPFDPYGSVGIVKRGTVAYYAWAQELYFYDGKTTKRILGSVDCEWMFVDENGDLWIGIKGGIGIAGDRVQQWDSAYRYDRKMGAFVLMRQESQKLRFVDGQGFVMYGPYYLYVEGGVLKASHTGTGAELTIDTVCSNSDIRALVEHKAIYYQNAKREYRMLSNLGEQNQGKTALDLSKFPDGVFQCGQYAVDDSNVLYRFRRNGYESLGKLSGMPAGAAAPPALSDSGIGFPGVDTVTLDYYDVKSRTWQRAGSSAQEGAFCQSTAEGRHWFVNWKPAALFQIYKGKYAKYDLSAAMTGCTWAGLMGDMVFLSEDDFYSDFTHVFLPETRTLYEITVPPLPGDRQDN